MVVRVPVVAIIGSASVPPSLLRDRTSYPVGQPVSKPLASGDGQTAPIMWHWYAVAEMS